MDARVHVQALLRVPAGGEARAALPLILGEALLPPRITRDHRWVRRVEDLPLGLPVAVAHDEAPLRARRGRTVASLGLVNAVAAAALGLGLLTRQGPRWLREARTRERMTISMGGSLTFLVGAVGRRLTLSLAMGSVPPGHGLADPAGGLAPVGLHSPVSTSSTTSTGASDRSPAASGPRTPPPPSCPTPGWRCVRSRARTSDPRRTDGAGCMAPLHTAAGTRAAGDQPVIASQLAPRRPCGFKATASPCRPSRPG